MLATFAPDTFIGRHAEVETIFQGICAETPRSIVLHGRRMIGKTTLLRYLSHPDGAMEHYKQFAGAYAPHQKNQLWFIYADMYNVVGDGIITTLYSNLVKNKHVSQALGVEFDTEISCDKSTIKRIVRNTCQEVQDKNTRLVFCIDHFDKAYTSLKIEDDIFLRSLVTYQAFIYVTDKSLPELRPSNQRFSPLYNILLPREIGLLNDTEAREIFAIATEENLPKFTAEDADFLLAATGNHPYLLSLACEYLYNLYLENIKLQSILPQSEKAREQVRFEILSLPAVQEIFAFYWDELEAIHRHHLMELARIPQLKASDQGMINVLRKKGLVKIDLIKDQANLFSELFRMYILEQKNNTRRNLEINALDLPQLDQKLLEYLQAKPDQVCTFDELLSNIWEDPEATRGSLDAAIHRVRRKLKDVSGIDWVYIDNVRGVGYKYAPPH
jgi:hypothetical protein